MNNIDLIIKNNLCVGCLNCQSVCPFGAIRSFESDYIKPSIDPDVCKNCSKCISVCPIAYKSHSNNKSYPICQYVGFFDDDCLTKKSSSGGIATAIAKNIIDRGGCVYGATVIYEKNRLFCKHICISDSKDIFYIQGSKYIQSHVTEAINDCVKKVMNGELVAFFGTSCQIEAVKTRLNGINCDNLYLIDLVCHGVPRNDVFDDYIMFLENKYKGSIIDISFRKKSKINKEINNYVITITIKKKDNITIKRISLRNSGFYRMYMSMAGYRPSCYNCHFSNISKPSDLTLGDFYGLDSKAIPKSLNRSLVMVNTPKGSAILQTLPKLVLEKVSIETVLNTHEQLIKPSAITRDGKKLLDIYSSKGFKGVHKYLLLKNTLTFFPSCIKRLFKRAR